MKVYYPFYTFQSRSDKTKEYIVNLRPPDEISCTCGAWKYYRNKEGNNGNCLHTRTIRQLFDIKWKYDKDIITPTELSVNFIGENSDIINEIYIFTIRKLNSLNIPIVDSINLISISIDINYVFSRLAREAIKAKQQRENNKPITLADLVAEKMKSELIFNMDFSNPSPAEIEVRKSNVVWAVKQDILAANKNLIFTDLYGASAETKNKINYVQQLSDLLKTGFLLSPEKISVVMYYIEQIGGDIGDGRLINNNNEIGIDDYKKSRNIQIRRIDETEEKNI